MPKGGETPAKFYQCSMHMSSTIGSSMVIQLWLCTRPFFLLLCFCFVLSKSKGRDTETTTFRLRKPWGRGGRSYFPHQDLNPQNFNPTTPSFIQTTRMLWFHYMCGLQVLKERGHKDSIFDVLKVTRRLVEESVAIKNKEMCPEFVSTLTRPLVFTLCSVGLTHITTQVLDWWSQTQERREDLLGTNSCASEISIKKDPSCMHKGVHKTEYIIVTLCSGLNQRETTDILSQCA